MTLRNMARLLRKTGTRIRRRALGLRWLPQAYSIRYVRRGPVWRTDKRGVTLQIHPDDDLQRLLSSETFYDDPGVLAYLDASLRPRMTVVDVGAHWGEFTATVAQTMTREARVFAFEPVQQSYSRLLCNVDRLGVDAPRVLAINRAVGARSCETEMHVFAQRYSAWNSFSAHRMPDRSGNWQSPSTVERVSVTTIDDFANEYKVHRIDLLKIDVEGHESEVLRGCRQLLNGSRIGEIVFEISMEPLHATGRDAKSVLLEFAELGMALSRIRSNGTLEPVRAEAYTPPYFANYLARPEER